MIKIIEVPISSITDICAKYCVDERQEVYYMAYATDPSTPLSVLWKDLTFIRKHYGTDRLKGESSETSNVTNVSLNFGRRINIANLKIAIELKANEFDVQEYYHNGSWDLHDNRNYHKPLSNRIDGALGLDEEKLLPFKPRHANKSTIEKYKADIAKGLYVVCKYV